MEGHGAHTAEASGDDKEEDRLKALHIESFFVAEYVFGELPVIGADGIIILPGFGVVYHGEPFTGIPRDAVGISARKASHLMDFEAEHTESKGALFFELRGIAVSKGKACDVMEDRRDRVEQTEVGGSPFSGIFLGDVTGRDEGEDILPGGADGCPGKEYVRELGPPALKLPQE